MSKRRLTVGGIALGLMLGATAWVSIATVPLRATSSVQKGTQPETPSTQPRFRAFERAPRPQTPQPAADQRRVDVPPGAVRVGGDIRPPPKTRTADPLYPEAARAAQVSGVVILDILVDAEGRVTDVEILRSLPLLDDSAVEAVRQWRYAPTLLNGVAVPVLMTVTVNFQSR